MKRMERSTMAKRIKLPKRIAGIKIPKGIRKGPVIKFLNSPAGQVVLAQALLAIGGVFAVEKARDNDEPLNPADALKDATRNIGNRADVAGAKLTRAFAAAAHAFRDVMESDDDRTFDHDSMDSNVEAGRKKSRVRSEPPSTPH
jgi:hypothetical protein